MSALSPTIEGTTDRPAERQLSLLQLCLMALVLGAGTGLGAVAFRALVALVHNLFFLGTVSVYYNSNDFTPWGPYGLFVALAPVIGSFGVTFLVKTFAPEAKGHGVPEVMDAIYYREGRIRPRVALVKSLASALSIGSGAAVGREGPIIQIGSAIGSTLGQFARLAPWQRITLVAAGAGAGIAATFNTPLGAVLFAVELMMPEVSPRTFLPVVLATGAATYVGRLAFGLAPAFLVDLASAPHLAPTTLSALAGYAGLGVLCGLASFAFIRVLVRFEDLFPRLQPNEYLRHAMGMAAIGVTMVILHLAFGHYYIEGVGYATIQSILRGGMTGAGLLALLYVLKLLATCVSLGSGASGGIFSPSLYMGATLGGAVGAVLDQIWPGAGFSPIGFAIAGMAGLVGGGTGAALTAVFMIFEMTRDYNVILPMIVVVTLAVGVRRALSDENIYTIKLVRRGHFIPKDRHSNMFLVRYVRDLMDAHCPVLPAETPLTEALARFETPLRVPGHIVVTAGDLVVGMVRADAALRARDGLASATRLADVMASDIVFAGEEETVRDVLRRMGRSAASAAVIVADAADPSAGAVRGVLTRENVGDAVLQHFQA